MTSDTDSASKVLSFPGAEPLPENLIALHDSARTLFCHHERIALDEHTRSVTCRQCARVLDPFDFLRHNARTLQMAWRNHASASAKVDELTARIEVLSKEHKRLQGKVARLREKVPALDVRGKDRL